MTTLQAILAAFAGFLSNILIPVLFGIAFLFFLINIFRYFILEGANEQSRDKAKRSALYGLAAFVFLLVLWGLVGVLVSGLNLTRDRSLCSDYISMFSGDCGQDGSGFASETNFPVGGSSGGSGYGGSYADGGTGGSYTSGGTSGGGSTGGGANNDTYNSPQVSPLAELVFGTGKDAARFAANQTPPQALGSTPTIPSNASCAAGLDTLQQASRLEDNQAAYLFTTNGTSRSWTNVTDGHSTNGIIFDADTIQSSQSTDDAVYLAHTHPKGRLDTLGLAATTHGPTTADVMALCSDNESPATHIVVSWAGAWLITTTDETCPLTTTTTAALPIIETMIALAGLESSSRITELEQYLEDELPPANTKTYFTEEYSDQTTNSDLLSNASVSELAAQNDAVLAESGISIEYFESNSDLCNAL